MKMTWLHKFFGLFLLFQPMAETNQPNSWFWRCCHSTPYIFHDSTHCAQIITLQPLRMLRYVIFVLNAIGLALWALTFFEFICANVANFARKRYLVHDICQSTLILACIDAHPNAPYSPNEVDFEKKGKNLLWPHIAEILHYHYGKSSNYFLNITPNWHEAGHFPPLVISGSDFW